MTEKSETTEISPDYDRKEYQKNLKSFYEKFEKPEVLEKLKKVLAYSLKFESFRPSEDFKPDEETLIEINKWIEKDGLSVVLAFFEKQFTGFKNQLKEICPDLTDLEIMVHKIEFVRMEIDSLSKYKKKLSEKHFPKK